MRSKYLHYIGISVIIAMLIMAVYFYPIMPERIAIHFNAHGLPDRFVGKLWGIFLIPLISMILYIVFILIPHIDPLGNNIKEFRYYYDMFVSLLILFLFYMELTVILFNFGIKLNILRFISVPVGLIYVYLGVLLLKSKRNWFVGIRTPWTLSSDEVWLKTNRLAGKFFIVDGVLVMLSFITGRFSEIFMIWIPLVFILFIVVYSYFLWKNIRNGETA